MKKQYIQPTTLVVATLSTALLAGSGEPQGGSDEYQATYGNQQNPGSSVTGNIESTGEGTGLDGGFTQGAKHNSFSSWDD